MGREYEPTVGQWYEDLENEETFQVLKVDEDKETVEIQHLDGDIEEFDVDGWAELDLELAEEPEGMRTTTTRMMTTTIWTTTKKIARNTSPLPAWPRSQTPCRDLPCGRT